MRKNNPYIILVLIVFLFAGIPPTGKTQNLTDTLHLAEFEVKANYIIDNQGFKRIQLDSITLLPHINANLSTVLAEYSTIFIKSYGNGTLSTPSLRGTTAQHTQVMWNGIILNSPMLGQIDLSQVPVSQFDKIEILYGAAGIALTSGAFGGVINLVTVPDWLNRLHIVVAQTIGSFDNYTTNLNVVTGTKNFQSQTKFIYASGLNDFPYYNEYLSKDIHQPNASFKEYGFTQEIFFKLKDHHLFSAKVWYNQSDRNLPSTTMVYNPDFHERQKDNDLRAVVEYKYLHSNYNLMVHTALSDQFMNYSSPIVDASHQVYTWINRARFTYTGIAGLTLKPGIDFNYDWAISDDYTGVKRRATTSLYAEIMHATTRTLKSSLVIREEVIDGKFMPLIATIGGEYKPFHTGNFALTANLVRNYRFPTLNELYWVLSGNPDLKPESYLGMEAGCTWNTLTANRRFFIETTLTGYYSWIRNMIIWTPVDGNSSLWRPENVAEVNARGIETGLNLRWRLWGFDLGCKNNYTFCLSTYEKSSSENDKKVGKQLIYTPENTFNSLVSIERWRFYLRYNYMFVGKRFTSTDNLYFMPAYNLSNLILGKSINLNNICLNLQVEIQNLFDLDYQSIASRPMPRINYAVTLKITFAGKERQ